MSIYSQAEYCVYLTIYSGNKMPQFYIGYTKTKNIEKGYRGSVKSKKYTITYSNGDTKEIFNLKKFCVENKMHYTSVVRAFKEKRKYKDIFISELSANT